MTKGRLKELCQLKTPFPTLPTAHPFHLAQLKCADPPSEVGQQAWVRSYQHQTFFPCEHLVHIRNCYPMILCLCECALANNDELKKMYNSTRKKTNNETCLSMKLLAFVSIFLWLAFSPNHQSKKTMFCCCCFLRTINKQL